MTPRLVEVAKERADRLHDLERSSLLEKAKDQAGKRNLDCLQITEIIGLMIETYLNDPESPAQYELDMYSESLGNQHLDQLTMLDGTTDINEILLAGLVVEDNIGRNWKFLDTAKISPDPCYRSRKFKGFKIFE